MLEQVKDLPGQVLNLEDYLADFWPHYENIRDVLWKLERAQDFREPDWQSWRAMMDGDWELSMRLLEETGPTIVQDLRDGLGFELRRIRVVESPVTPYLQWEMQVLQKRVDAGEQIRVIDAQSIKDLETKHTVPELVVLGETVMYQVLYDDTGTASGARKISDSDAIAACRVELAALFDQGEDLRGYFDREIASLPPPKSST